jgi:hypothetical protein
MRINPDKYVDSSSSLSSSYVVVICFNFVNQSTDAAFVAADAGVDANFAAVIGGCVVALIFVFSVC